jgi:hypothetical protein
VFTSATAACSDISVSWAKTTLTDYTIVRTVMSHEHVDP